MPNSGMTAFYLVGAPVLATLLCFLFTPVVRNLAIRLGAVDHPGPRKIHSTDIPRLGGLAVVGSVAIVAGLLVWSELPHVDRIADDLALGISLGLLPILVISVWDDLRPLKAAPKFLAQFAGAAIAVACGIRLGSEVHMFGHTVSMGVFAIPISLLWIAGITNAFNIVDGLDGLSAGLALLSALSLAAGSAMVGQVGLALFALVLAGALVGFLPHNIYPARIFLGDSGATAIGFCLACLALRGGSTLSSGLAIVTPILVLGLPIAETLVSMLRRVVRGWRAGAKLGVFEADAGHFHHRLLALGLDQRHAVYVLYGVGMALSLAGFGSLFLSQKKAAVLLLTMLAAAVVGLSRLGYEEFAILRRGDLLRVYEVPVLRKSLFVVFVDLAVVVFSIYGAFVLKYDDWGLTWNRHGAIWLTAVLPSVSLAAFSALGLYRRVWRFASLADLTLGSAAVTTAAAVSLVLSLLFNPRTPPVTWFVICYLMMLLGLVGSRASYRLLQDFWKRSQAHGEPVLIYGAGNAGAMILREILSNQGHGMRPIGFIDDDPAIAGKVFSGYPIFGTVDALDATIARHGIQGLVMASLKVPADRLHRAARSCERRGIWMRGFEVRFQERPADATVLIAERA